MHILHAHNLSYQLCNGDTVFNNLSCSISHQRTSIVGKNGIGKSILAKLLAKQLQPSQGSVELMAQADMFSQEPVHFINSDITVAQFLGYEKTLQALDLIAQGQCEQHLFDLVAERWQLPEQLSTQLSTLGLPNNPHLPCNTLSGGQLARLRLWQLFNSQAQLLILDEPSNHLDAKGQAWLIEQLNTFTGYALIISHNHELLRHVTQTWELSEIGLRKYGGNIEHYLAQKHSEQRAVTQQLHEVKRQQAQLKLQTQTNKEKAQQRAAQGKKLRNQGSQPKMLLNSQKNRAGSNLASKQKNQQQRQHKLHSKTQLIQQKHQQNTVEKFYLSDPTQSALNKKTLVTLLNVHLPFGTSVPINLTVCTQQKWHIKGSNGCGKSTLFKTLLNQLAPLSGELFVNTPLSYVDQYFSQLGHQLNSVQALNQYCPHLSTSNIYTLLAGIGLTKIKTEQPITTLSGGEKMKLTLLCASQQQPTPLLLLDEPDNHLDLESKLQLAKALSQYQGSFLLVSHDTYFVNNIGITHMLKLKT
ncbi:Nucleotide-binding protein ExpZ [Pseudoalteromonas holothuriae]|uniref:Nucleotide-binding protein ExpZ n=1 Tax=Pseudoalteromonas holothuriae TaxID=2963714 RepID=A0ABN8URL2_9GAMM|nr:ATP-binding cassette domain-containing protein [Pseudoalteromonas sp. CIP111951]CAH9064516.1 Nucleotide-binding protein ExpZ [Pseudoalteromonas sp. CIP111951]